MIWAFKIRGCVDCGIRPPAISLDQLHCDHLDPTMKIARHLRNISGNVGGLLEMNSHRQLLEELAKCEPVCVECHKIRTKRRASGDGITGFWEQRALF